MHNEIQKYVQFNVYDIFVYNSGNSVINNRIRIEKVFCHFRKIYTSCVLQKFLNYMLKKTQLIIVKSNFYNK
jgi:methyltransferase-like protein